MKNGMIDNLCFDGNANTKRAEEALKTVLRKRDFWFVLRGHISGFDKDNGDVLYFFPIEDFSKVRKETKAKFISNLIEAWKNANLELVEQTELTGDIYFHVGFRSIFFKLKSTI